MTEETKKTNTKPNLDRSAKLLRLAEDMFGDDISNTEKILFVDTANGYGIDYGDGDPSEAEKWGDERLLRADRIEWLCTNRDAAKEITHNGVCIIGAIIKDVLDLSFARIDFPLLIARSAILSGINMEFAHLYALNLAGTHSGPICANDISVEKSVYMSDGFRAEGIVTMNTSNIGGNLVCNGGHFINPDDVAFNANGIKVMGSIIFREDCKVEGEVDLGACLIGNDIDFSNGLFSNPKGISLCVNGSTVKRSIFFGEGFKSEGEVNLDASTIGRGIECENSQFSNPNGIAFSAMSVNVKYILLCDIIPEGSLYFKSATISGEFYWRNDQIHDQCSLNLESSNIGTLDDEESSWPKKLHLNGLEYNSFGEQSPTDWQSRLKWLNLQDNTKFTPQPYEQLAKVLNEMGHEHDAHEILIAKQKDRAQRYCIAHPRRIVHYLSGWTIGYGYRSWQALLWLVGFFVIGFFVFSPDWTDVKYITLQGGDIPKLNPFLYSFDCLVPIVDINQAQYRIPEGWQYIYRCFHIIVGWVFTTLYVVGLTGLVRK